VRDALNPQGMNIIQSNGLAAGQSVFHLHVHVVPRETHDRMPSLWPPDAAWSDSQLDESASMLRSGRPARVGGGQQPPTKSE
jgi:histidine triad (HIT) family protein